MAARPYGSNLYQLTDKGDKGNTREGTYQECLAYIQQMVAAGASEKRFSLKAIFRKAAR